MSQAAIVTGYIPIVGHPRSAKEYGKLGEKIFGPLSCNVFPFYEKVENTWLYKMVQKRMLPVRYSEGDNPAKNSLAYHYANHQKFAWMLKASMIDKFSETFVWIDYGIGHVPGVTAAVIDELMVKVQPNDFAIPGCWPADGLMVSDLFPCWRFCGGVMVVPRDVLLPLFLAVKHEMRRWLDQTNNVSWEVNTLARIEQTFQPKPRWYLADHNETLFTNYGVDLCSASSPVSADQSAITFTLH